MAALEQTNEDREAAGGPKTHTHRQRIHIAERQRETPDSVDRVHTMGDKTRSFLSLSLLFHMENRPTAGIQKSTHTHTHTHTHGVKHPL